GGGGGVRATARRRRFDYLHPLASPPGEIGTPQLLLDFRTLLGGHAARHRTATPSPRRALLARPSAQAYPLPLEFTSGYLAWIIHGGGIVPDDACKTAHSGTMLPMPLSSRFSWFGE